MIDMVHGDCRPEAYGGGMNRTRDRQGVYFDGPGALL